MPLPEDQRLKLDSIVQRMEAAGEPEENIQAVVEDFKSRTSGPAASSELPSASPLQRTAPPATGPIGQAAVDIGTGFPSYAKGVGGGLAQFATNLIRLVRSRGGLKELPPQDQAIFDQALQSLAPQTQEESVGQEVGRQIPFVAGPSRGLGQVLGLAKKHPILNTLVSAAAEGVRTGTVAATEQGTIRSPAVQKATAFGALGAGLGSGLTALGGSGQGYPRAAKLLTELFRPAAGRESEQFASNTLPYLLEHLPFGAHTDEAALRWIANHKEQLNTVNAAIKASYQGEQVDISGVLGALGKERDTRALIPGTGGGVVDTTTQVPSKILNAQGQAQTVPQTTRTVTGQVVQDQEFLNELDNESRILRENAYDAAAQRANAKGLTDSRDIARENVPPRVPFEQAFNKEQTAQNILRAPRSEAPPNSPRRSAEVEVRALKDALYTGRPDLAQSQADVSAAIQGEDLLTKAGQTRERSPSNRLGLTRAIAAGGATVGAGLGFAGSGPFGAVAGGAAGAYLPVVILRVLASPQYKFLSLTTRVRFANLLLSGKTQDAEAFIARALAGEAGQYDPNAAAEAR